MERPGGGEPLEIVLEVVGRERRRVEPERQQHYDESGHDAAGPIREAQGRI